MPGVKFQMIIENIKRIIAKRWTRWLCFIFLLVDLAALYWINIMKHDFYYPSSYEDAYRISVWLILVAVLIIIVLFMGFRKAQRAMD
jgi:hypothetical protein